MKIYTKTGDAGETALYDGKRVPKNSPRIRAYGNIDELNSNIGLVVTIIRSRKIKSLLVKIQKDLFILGSHVATPSKKDQAALPDFSNSKIKNLERVIDDFSKNLKPLTHFVLPGGSKQSSHLHIARTVCRRAERSCVALSEKEELFEYVVPYLNRLSDLLFVLARHFNKGKDTPA